ncbi:MATE family efflux transporter [Sphingobium algorifonticola]|uniref:MATE family efflux transporter n=1 Tax=Sphingobium algorifonticola TaxID=2008318 RepID=A0A437J5G0_9SPHN|nr:MATE family efflux transporter [Sphingobium algorifonticola]RVT40180.1 MATE family efflux transporter [Sphingobium algorifonticola]
MASLAIPLTAMPWRTEARALIALALPMIVGNIAWSGIAATDLLLLGRLGPDAVAAGALGINLYTACLVFGMGLTTAASPLIAAERGRRRHAVREIRRTVRQTLWAAALLCLPCWLLLWHGEGVLVAMGQDRALSADAGQLMRGLQWALLPYLGFLTLRNYISALERPVWGVVVVVLAIPFNLLVGWALIFGHLGMPPLGMFGAGLGASLTALFMLCGLIAVILIDRGFARYRLFGRFWVADWPRFAAVWKIGLPIAIMLGLEVTVFNAAVFLMGLIGRAPLAAHAIAIQIISLGFMVPLGIGQAATVRVGLAYGRGDPAAIGRAGWLAIGIGVGFALLAAAVLILMPGALIAIFIDIASPANAPVVALAQAFLAVAALFQIVDCTQAVCAGVLRGLQDTRVPMVVAAGGYWIIGIGVGALLAFYTGLGGVGLWWGLASGLGFVAAVLTWRWHLRDRLGLTPGLAVPVTKAPAHA